MSTGAFYKYTLAQRCQWKEEKAPEKRLVLIIPYENDNT